MGVGGAAAPSRVLFLAIHTMLQELAPNLWEDSLERLVDFGHVFSMELEMAQLHTEKLYHGEAVAVDMAFSAVLAFVRGQITADYRDRLLPRCRASGCPSTTRASTRPWSRRRFTSASSSRRDRRSRCPPPKGSRASSTTSPWTSAARRSRSGPRSSEEGRPC